MNNQSMKNGFTLIEVVLAVLAMAFSVFAICSLFQSGLRTCANSATDASLAIFADGVLNTLRTESAIAAENGAWETHWSDVANTITNITVPCGANGFWNDVIVVGAGESNTVVFSTTVHHAGGGVGSVSNTFQYYLDVCYPSEAGAHRADVVLKVWKNNDNQAVFYSEFRKEGDL